RGFSPRSRFSGRARAITGCCRTRNSPPKMRRGGAKRRGGVDQRIHFIEQHHPPLRGCPPQLRRAVACLAFGNSPISPRLHLQEGTKVTNISFFSGFCAFLSFWIESQRIRDIKLPYIVK